LSKKHHPDTPGGNKERFLEINDAYHTLGDEGRRYVLLLFELRERLSKRQTS
jgi:DnaJ-class molecular chaperone